MSEILGKILPDRTAYNEHRSQRVKEDQLAVDGLYGVMLAINADRPSAILLPALVTGCGPYTASRLAFLRMLNREQQPRPIHVSIIDGTFTQFDSTILVPGQVARPEVEEGFLIKHPEIIARSQELTTLLTQAGGAV